VPTRGCEPDARRRARSTRGRGGVIGIEISTSKSSHSVGPFSVTIPDTLTTGTVTSASSTGPLLTMNTDVTLYLSAPGGYTGTGTFEIGSVQHASAGMQNGALTLGTSCQVNDQTDAVIPFIMSVTHTSSGFSASPGYTVTIAGCGAAVDLDGTIPSTARNANVVAAVPSR
jgi:hypothetical protein